jgi:hypothetical protein
MLFRWFFSGQERGKERYLPLTFDFLFLIFDFPNTLFPKIGQGGQKGKGEDRIKS